jgi:tetratricopeptide (TPR) repeat protein
MAYSLFYSYSLAADKRKNDNKADFRSLYAQGLDFYNNRKFAQAVDTLTKVIDLNPADSTLISVCLQRGAAYGYLGQREKALKDFEFIILNNPKAPMLYYMRAVTVYLPSC